MPLLPLTIPPGIYSHGTEYDSAGRWRDGSLVRFRNGSPRPVGGWNARVESGIAAAPRGALAWRTNTGGRFAAFGTYNKLYIVSGSTAFDITPVGLTAGAETAAVNTGYGAGLYGLSTYGTPRVESEGTVIPATVWTLDSWGEYLIACSDADGKLYEWQLNTGVPAAAITNAPVNCEAMVVTAERFVMALGAGGNPRLVQWCDREANTVWAPEATNEAGDLELQTAGQIMLGLRVRGRTLILTNLDAHVATYTGPPTVYGMERVGTGCGARSRQCAVAVGNGALWMGEKAFFQYDGSGVIELPCEVQDKVFRDLNAAQASKVAAVHNETNGEVWWFYPSEDSLENNRYVAYDYVENVWMIGAIARTCGVDSGVYRFPMWASPAGVVYNHETVGTYDGNLPFLESGPVDLTPGDQVMRVTELIPDELNQGDVEMVFKTRFHPNDVEREYGPYTLANPTSVRFTGRQIRMRLQATGAGFWTAGTQRLEVRPGGRR